MILLYIYIVFSLTFGLTFALPSLPYRAAGPSWTLSNTVHRGAVNVRGKFWKWNGKWKTWLIQYIKPVDGWFMKKRAKTGGKREKPMDNLYSQNLETLFKVNPVIICGYCRHRVNLRPRGMSHKWGYCRREIQKKKETYPHGGTALWAELGRGTASVRRRHWSETCEFGEA